MPEVMAGVVVCLLPFAAWNTYRTTLMDPSMLAIEAPMFLVGDLSRFLTGSYYVKPALILGAMVMCGIGVPLAVLRVEHVLNR